MKLVKIFKIKKYVEQILNQSFDTYEPMFVSEEDAKQIAASGWPSFVVTNETIEFKRLVNLHELKEIE